MAHWEKVARCKSCGKIYADGTPGICSKCGKHITSKNAFLNYIGTKKCMVFTENPEHVIARKKLFRRWEIKEQ